MCTLNRYLILLMTSMVFLVPPVFSQGKNTLFRSNELKSTELSAFKKWAGLRARHEADTPNNASNPLITQSLPCVKTKNFKCVSNEWRSVMQSAGQMSKVEQLRAINHHLNQVAYVTDMVNWQQNDYWATIRQFFRKNGDCEDYAIAKFYSLKELGFESDQMRIVIVQDNNLNIAHAVLAVYLDDKIWILDNQISNIVTDDNIVHYTPLYSINENAWWLHKSL